MQLEPRKRPRRTQALSVHIFNAAGPAPAYTGLCYRAADLDQARRDAVARIETAARLLDVAPTTLRADIVDQRGWLLDRIPATVAEVGS